MTLTFTFLSSKQGDLWGFLFVCLLVLIFVKGTIAGLNFSENFLLTTESIRKLVYILTPGYVQLYSFLRTAYLRGICHILCVLRHSVMSDSLQPLWNVTRQAPLSLGILQARILEWVAMPSSKGSSNLGSDSSLPNCRQILYCLSQQGSPSAP